MARTRMRRASDPALAMSVVTVTSRAVLASSKLWSLRATEKSMVSPRSVRAGVGVSMVRQVLWAG